MVMLSGYESFVSKLDIAPTQKPLAWLGKLDAGSLKLKVAASIVAISSIHLLGAFMGAEADVARHHPSHFRRLSAAADGHGPIGGRL